MFSRSTIATLAIAWITTIAFLTVGHEYVVHPPNTAIAVGCFVLILGAIMVAAFGVVRQAEHLAEKVGEPFGTGDHRGAERPPARSTRSELITRSVLLVLTVLPIVLLAHDLGILVDRGIELTGAPVALGGVIIAIIVFTPEAITAVRAALADENQRALNLGLGAFVSTVGLTIPAILVIGLITGQPVILGESPANMVLICITLVMTVITYFAPRTTAVHGAVHLMLFGVYGVLIFAP